MTLTYILLQPMSKDPFGELTKKIQENIAPQERKDLQDKFKKDVPYWQRLNWQVQSDIWNDIRMNSKYGFQLFHKFLKENKSTVIKANGKGVDIVNQFQKVFSETVDDYGLRGRQNLKSQQLKQKLSKNSDAFKETLFKKIECIIQGKPQQNLQPLQASPSISPYNFQPPKSLTFKPQQNQQSSFPSPPSPLQPSTFQRKPEYVSLSGRNQNHQECTFGEYKKPIIIIGLIIIIGVLITVLVVELSSNNRRLLMADKSLIIETKHIGHTPIYEKYFNQTIDNQLKLYNQDIFSILWNFISTLNLSSNLRTQADLPFSDEIKKALKEINFMSNPNWHQQISEYDKSQIQNIKASEISLLQEEILQVA